MEQTIEMETNFRMHQTHFKWAIKDWDKVYQGTGGIRSRDFRLKGISAKIYFTFHLGHSDLELNVIIEHNQLIVRPDVNAYVLEVKNMKASMTEVPGRAEKGNRYRYRFSLPNPSLDVYKIQKLYVMNDTLTIYCDIKYYEHIIKVKELSDLPLKGLITVSQQESVQEKKTVFMDESSDEDSNKSSDNRLDKPENQPYGKYSLNEYVKFFEESKLCDVAFVFELEEVKAHKAILVRMSPFFRYRLTEKRANERGDFRIDCTGNENISPSILRCFLEYLYGIKTFDDLRSSIGLMKMYILAKEFRMDSMEILCQYYMSKSG